MSASEQVLRVLHTRSQLELATVTGNLARAMSTTSGARLRADAAAERSSAAGAQLRQAMQRPLLDPTLLTAMYRVHVAEQGVSRDEQAQLAAARSSEAQVRGTFAAARNREAALQRALHTERRRQREARQQREALAADELWLQRRSQP